MRVKIEPADVVGVETGLRASQVGNRRSHTPVGGGGPQGLIDHIEPETGQVKNAGFVAWCGSGKCLQATYPERRHEAIAAVVKNTSLFTSELTACQ